MYDTAIIGGGPVGSRIAARLAESGFSVVVLDRKQTPDEPVCCTGIIGNECVGRFDVPDHLVIGRLSGARIFSPSGTELRLARPESQACVVDRVAFNKHFIRRAEDSGAEYMFSTAVKDIKVDSYRAVIETSSESVYARTVVLACGAGANFSGLADSLKDGDIAGGAQTLVEIPEMADLEIYTGKKIAPGFFAWLVPLGKGQALAGLMSRRRPRFYLQQLIESLKSQGKIKTVLAEILTAGVALKPVAKTYSRRVLIAGSAAGQVKPTTAGGIYYGLLCADLATDSLRQGLESDNLSNRALSGYQREWKKLLGRDIRTGRWGRNLYELLTDRQMDSLFGLIKNHGIDKAVSEADDLSFDWHGEALLKMMGNSALFGAIKKMQLPLRWISR